MSRREWAAGYLCPHCGVEHTNEVPMCADREWWTNDERLRWRRLALAAEPSLRLVATYAGDQR